MRYQTQYERDYRELFPGEPFKRKSKKEIAREAAHLATQIKRIERERAEEIELQRRIREHAVKLGLTPRTVTL